MSAHSCARLDPECFRCDLNRDEMVHERLDHLRVAKLLRGVAGNPKRRPGTRGLLLDLSEEMYEKADEIAHALGMENYQ